MTPAELCAKHPYVPGTNAWDYPRGTPEQLRGVPPEGGMREALASFYLACEPRWIGDELKVRERELRREQQKRDVAKLAQSREHVDSDDWRNR